MASTLPVPDSCCDPCVGSATVAFISSSGWPIVADFAALRALPASALNTGARIATTSGFTGDYIWDPLSVAADDGITIIAPSDGGVGRWVKVL